MVRAASAFRPADRGHAAPRRRQPRGGRARDTRGRGAAGADGRGAGRSPTRAHSTPPSIACDATTGWCSPRPMASGSFSQRLTARGRDLRALGHLKLAAIGPATAEALAGCSPQCRSRARDISLGGAGGRTCCSVHRAAKSCSLGPIADEPSSRTSSRSWPKSTRSPSTTTPMLSALPESVVERIMAGTIDWITLTSPAITARLYELSPTPKPAARHSAATESGLRRA